MAKEPADQPRSTPAQIAAVKASTTLGTYVFSAPVVVTHDSNILEFRDGVAYPLHAPLLAYLIANGVSPTAQ